MSSEYADLQSHSAADTRPGRTRRSLGAPDSLPAASHSSQAQSTEAPLDSERPDPTLGPQATNTEVDKSLETASLSPDLDDIASLDDVTASIDELSYHLYTVAGEFLRRLLFAQVEERWELPEDARELLRAKRAARRTHERAPTKENTAILRYYERAVKQRLREVCIQRWDLLLSLSRFLPGSHETPRQSWDELPSVFQPPHQDLL